LFCFDAKLQISDAKRSGNKAKRSIESEANRNETKPNKAEQRKKPSFTKTSKTDRVSVRLASKQKKFEAKPALP
jgi:hypothetical protein